MVQWRENRGKFGHLNFRPGSDTNKLGQATPLLQHLVTSPAAESCSDCGRKLMLDTSCIISVTREGQMANTDSALPCLPCPCSATEGAVTRVTAEGKLGSGGTSLSPFWSPSLLFFFQIKALRGK